MLVSMTLPARPLRRRAYGSIGHLPGSRVGPSDRHVTEGQARLCTVRVRDRHDRVIVQEKLDGSCVSVARVGDAILALGREGDLAARSPNDARRMWARWVGEQEARFLAVLADGERLAGEWLALAHSTRYVLSHEPFVVFDLLRGPVRAPWSELRARADRAGLTTPWVVHEGGAIAVEEALSRLGEHGHHGAIDPVEGAIWRLERDLPGGETRVDLVAKFVRPGKIDGAFLPETTGKAAVWNWLPAGEGPPTVR
jgi:hypothetical protein